MRNQARCRYADLAGVSDELHLPDCISNFCGEYVVVVWDKKTRRCYTHFDGDAVPSDVATTLDQYAPGEL